MTADAYLQIMIESLQKKSDVLDVMDSLEDEQISMSLQENGAPKSFDQEDFDKTMEKKGLLLEKLDKLDKGFEETYQLVREEVIEHKETYADQIHTLQSLVQSVVDKGVALKVKESRLKTQLDAYFEKERMALHQKTLSNKVAKGYANSMSRMNYIDPQLMDRKK